jgi:hypothetical protein
MASVTATRKLLYQWFRMRVKNGDGGDDDAPVAGRLAEAWNSGVKP